MTVTQVEPVTGTKTKYKVYLDGQLAFVLYKGELSRYRIRVGEPLGEEERGAVYDMLFKRAKLRAMHLLNDMDRTEDQLRKKLADGYYPAEIIDGALEYVKSFGYINDTSYAKRFIESRKDKKSRKEIYALLLKKGLSKDLIEEALKEVWQEEDSLEAIRNLIRKKRFDPGKATDKEKQKMLAYLLRKGYRYEEARQVIQVSDWEA